MFKYIIGALFSPWPYKNLYICLAGEDGTSPLQAFIINLFTKNSRLMPTVYAIFSFILKSIFFSILETCTCVTPNIFATSV